MRVVAERCGTRQFPYLIQLKRLHQRLEIPLQTLALLLVAGLGLIAAGIFISFRTPKKERVRSKKND